MTLAKTAGATGAYFEISGEQPNNSTWQEIIYFMQAGSPMVLTGLSFEMTFRCSDYSDSADYTLSTTAGTLAIQADATSGIANNLYINVPVGSLSGLNGDYVADLASKDQNGVITSWAHGIVSFHRLPVTF